MKRWFVWTVIAAVVTSFAVFAQAEEKKEGAKKGGAGGQAGMFKKMDGDGDGKVSCEEFVKAKNCADDAAKQKAEAAYKKMDANSDGALTTEEMQEWAKSHPPKGKAGEKKAGGAKKE